MLLILFDAYVHGALDRRGFLDKASRYAVGGVTVTDATAGVTCVSRFSPSRWASAKAVRS